MRWNCFCVFLPWAGRCPLIFSEKRLWSGWMPLEALGEGISREYFPKGSLLLNNQRCCMMKKIKALPPCYPSHSYSNPASNSASKLKWMQNSAPGVCWVWQHQAPTPYPQLRLCHLLGHNFVSQNFDSKFSYGAILYSSMMNVLLVLQAYCQRQGD